MKHTAIQIALCYLVISVMASFLYVVFMAKMKAKRGRRLLISSNVEGDYR